MFKFGHRNVLVTAALLLVCLTGGGCHANMDFSFSPTGGLTHDEVQQVLNQAEAAANLQSSLVRVNEQGQKQTTRMHIIITNRDGHVIGQRDMLDAWVGSISIATAKAYTAAAFSSDQNALTSRTIGALSQPGGPLWHIGNSNHDDDKPGLIEFPGGVPLYKNHKLVGAIGVSGDGVDEDEAVAIAGARGFEPATAIRVDTVTDGKVPYVK
jgi:uncharacterized protein GlcG (DUF336 family)